MLLLALDVVGFSQFKRAWQDALDQWELDNAGPLDKAAFLTEIEAPWKATFTTKTIRKSFEAIGIQPFNPNIIPAMALAPSLPNSLKQPAIIQDTKAQKAMKAVFADILAIPVVPPPNLYFNVSGPATESQPLLETPQNSTPVASPSCANRLRTLLQEDEHYFIVNDNPVSPSKPMPVWNPPPLLPPKPTATSVYGSIGLNRIWQRQSTIHAENLALRHDNDQLAKYAAGLQELVQKFEVNMTLQGMLLTQTQNQLKNERGKKKKSGKHLLPAGVATLLTADRFYDAVKEHKEKSKAEAAAKAARKAARTGKKMQGALDRAEKDRLQADWNRRVVLWQQQYNKLCANGVKVKDCPKRPPHPFHRRPKQVEEDVELSPGSETASESAEESQSGWVSGAAENDGFEASSSEDGHNV